MTITLRPWSDHDGMAVFRFLDPLDLAEEEKVRGAAQNALALFADWRAMEPHRIVSLVAYTGGGVPFALFGLCNTGQAGVAGAALVARNHQAFRRPLAELAVLIRRHLPLEAARMGVRRIEARCWFHHPTASSLLEALGFQHECDMGGFGSPEATIFRQFAWIAPAPAAQPPEETPTCA
jgi:hypothetical protein